MSNTYGHRGRGVSLKFAAGVCAALLMAGCSQVTIQPNPGLLGKASNLYSDQDWSEVLRKYVHEGLVDYEGLSRDRETLERYYATLAVTGPTRTPEQFTSSGQITAYWINAYNALVLLAVMERYPVDSMYDLALPRLEHEYTFQVDGRPRVLADIEEEILSQSQRDVRALFATSRAALGTPRLSDQPLRASTLDRQLTEAAAAGLENPNLLKIDHGGQAIRVWQVVLRRQDDFVAYWRNRRRVQTAYAFNVLLELASPQQRRVLQSAVGYSLREIEFDRGLNRWPLQHKDSTN